MQLIWRHLYSTKSASQHGTLHQFRNLIGRTNVKKDPSKDFNACEDFFTTVVQSLILCVCMQEFEMHSLKECPAQHVVSKDAWLEWKKKLITSPCNWVLVCWWSYKFGKRSCSRIWTATVECLYVLRTVIHSLAKYQCTRWGALTLLTWIQWRSGVKASNRLSRLTMEYTMLDLQGDTDITFKECIVTLFGHVSLNSEKWLLLMPSLSQLDIQSYRFLPLEERFL